jgi:hypothetical protein
VSHINTCRLVVLGAYFITAPIIADAEVVVFQEGVNGYSGTVDTWLMESAPEEIYSESPVVKWGRQDGGGRVYGLFKFDDIFGSGPGQIPDGATIVSATFAYNIVDCGHDAVVNQVLVDWDETVTYATFGGDAGVKPDEYGHRVDDAIGNTGKGYFSIDVTGRVKSWQTNPSANNGWIFRPTGNRVAEAGSSENPDMSKRPKLMVNYLPPLTAVGLYPDNIEAVVGSADVVVTVGIPIGSNDNRAVRVTLTSDNAGVAVPVGATNGSMVVTFPQGGATKQAINIDIGTVGSAVITTANDAGLKNDRLTVKVTKGIVRFQPGVFYAGVGYKIPIKVTISPGSNDNRDIRVTLNTGKPAIGGPARAVGKQYVLTFAKGGPSEQIVHINSNAVGMTSITTDNDGGLENSALPLNTIQSFEFTITCDMRSSTGPTGFGKVLDAITATGGAGEFMVVPGDEDPPANVNADLEAEFGAGFIWYPAVGNHEAETASDMTWLRTRFSSQPYVVNLGPPGSVETNYSFEYGDAHFVILNVYANGTNCDTCLGGDVVTALRNWLEADLAATSKKWIFVAGHEPAYPKCDADWGTCRHFGDSLDQHPSNRNAFWALLDTYNVTAYLVGHTHRYSRYLQDEVWQVDAAQSRGNGQYDTFIRVFVGADELIYHTYRSLTGGVFALTDQWTVQYTGGPRIVLNKSVIDQTIYVGDNLPNDTFTVTNGGPGTMNYTIIDDETWLDVSPGSGSLNSGEADTIDIIYNVSGLPVGQYDALITVSSGEATNSPQTLTVNLTVQTVTPDFNGDTDVDQEDFGHLQECMTGSGTVQTDPDCQDAKLDPDNDVDLDDFNIFLGCVSGANVPANKTCDD